MVTDNPRLPPKTFRSGTYKMLVWALKNSTLAPGFSVTPPKLTVVPMLPL
jgi:hypothetical protein